MVQPNYLLMPLNLTTPKPVVGACKKEFGSTAVSQPAVSAGLAHSLKRSKSLSFGG